MLKPAREDGRIDSQAVPKRPRSLLAPTLIVFALCAAVGVIAYVQIAVKRVEQELPLRVMEEKRDMERTVRNLYDFLAATVATQAHPTDGNLDNARDELAFVENDLGTLRERYTFDTLIGASALHALISPTIVDARTWLTEGFGTLEPTSPILLELVSTRTQDTIVKAFDKTAEADRIAYEILSRQTEALGRLRSRLVLVLGAVIALLGGIVWLAIRQQKARREQFAAETARERAQTRLRDALENTSEGFAFFDANEQLVIANSRYSDVFFKGLKDVVKPGVSFEAMLRAAIDRNLIADIADDPSGWLTNRLAHFRNPSGTFAVHHADGRWTQINERKTAEGGTVVVYSDITGLKRRESELVRAKEGAEALSDAKSNFLANVSHELRTPLTSIVGFARIVQKRFDAVVRPALRDEDAKVERASAQISTNLEIMLLEGERLSKLVNDVLDLEKIEAGEMVWNIAALDVRAMIEQAAAATQTLYAEKGLAFNAHVADGLPQILGDRDRVVQVLVNLISNAVKFTDDGAIECHARRKGTDAVEISVVDTGAGIAPEDQIVIFEKFRQVGDTLTEKPSGTGLGLPICREIVEHLGGGIRVESRLGHGSTFAFWLPCAPPGASPG